MQVMQGVQENIRSKDWCYAPEKTIKIGATHRKHERLRIDADALILFFIYIDFNLFLPSLISLLFLRYRLGTVPNWYLQLVS
jgi:hypothetical protein